MSDHMYARLHALDFWRYDDPATIDMFDKAQRFVQSFSYLFIQLVRMLTALVSLATSLWMMVMVSWWLGLLVLVAFAGWPLARAGGDAAAYGVDRAHP